MESVSVIKEWEDLKKGGNSEAVKEDIYLHKLEQYKLGT